MSYEGGYPAKKNKEFLLIFPIYNTEGNLVSGAADLDSEISKDGGGFIDCTNEATEIDTSGIYKLTLTADEMNANVVTVITKSNTAETTTTNTVIYTSIYQIEQLLSVGAIPWTYTLTEEETEDPISDADIWVTSKKTGTHVIASGKTNQNGKVTFYLDAGTVYIWRQKSGWNFVNPDTEVVS